MQSGTVLKRVSIASNQSTSIVVISLYSYFFLFLHFFVQITSSLLKSICIYLRIVHWRAFLLFLFCLNHGAASITFGLVYALYISCWKLLLSLYRNVFSDCLRCTNYWRLHSLSMTVFWTFALLLLYINHMIAREDEDED